MKLYTTVIVIFFTLNEIRLTIASLAPRTTSKCAPDSFECPSTGRCLRLKFVCNGVNNCGDNSDEIDCQDKLSSSKSLDDQNSTICPINMKSCPSGGCVEYGQHCEQYQKCNWNGTTFNCAKKCDLTEYRCSSSSCIPRSKLCNRVANCANFVDEKYCNTSFPTPSISINKTAKTLVKRSKWNKHDNEQPSQRSQLILFHDLPQVGGYRNRLMTFDCPDGLIPCPVRGCALNKQICEQFETCHWSGEKFICKINCLKTEFRCNSHSCIPEKMVCNGYSDCPDDIDEKYCPHRKNGPRSRSNQKQRMVKWNNKPIKHMIKSEKDKQTISRQQQNRVSRSSQSSWTHKTFLPYEKFSNLEFKEDEPSFIQIINNLPKNVQKISIESDQADLKLAEKLMPLIFTKNTQVSQSHQ